MNTPSSRITPMELSRKQVDSQTVQAYYKAGYGFFTVTSKFSGDNPLGDLFFEVIQKNEKLAAMNSMNVSTFALL